MVKSLKVVLLSGAVVVCFGQLANAQTVLFSDNFNRADSRNIQASLTGITDNTGSSLTAGGVYSQPWLDPNNATPTYGTQDSNAANGGGAQILSDQLQLAVGAGTSDLFVNNNFINSSILSAGGFSVSVDMDGESQSTANQGAAFAIGMSQSGAASTGDAFDEGLAYNGEGPSMTGAFNTQNGIGSTVPGQVVSDFWVALLGNGTLIWGGGNGSTISGVTGLGKTGTVSASLTFSSFDAGSVVNYDIYFNGSSEGTGSFTWTGTDENYIGLDGRDSTAVTFDNLSITTVPEPSTIALIAVGAVGLLIRRRKV
jgi:PEP-CTERM motif